MLTAIAYQAAYEAAMGTDLPNRLFFELSHAPQPADWRYARQQPRHLGMCRHMRLHKDLADVRVHSTS